MDQWIHSYVWDFWKFCLMPNFFLSLLSVFSLTKIFMISEKLKMRVRSVISIFKIINSKIWFWLKLLLFQNETTHLLNFSDFHVNQVNALTFLMTLWWKTRVPLFQPQSEVEPEKVTSEKATSVPSEVRLALCLTLSPWLLMCLTVESWWVIFVRVIRPWISN